MHDPSVLSTRGPIQRPTSQPPAGARRLKAVRSSRGIFGDGEMDEPRVNDTRALLK